MTAETFGEHLRRLRQDHKLSLRQLSALSHIDYSQLSKVENGRRAPGAILATAVDEALNANGALVAHAQSDRVQARTAPPPQTESQTTTPGTTDDASPLDSDPMRRRTVLRHALIGLAAGPAARLTALEAIRGELAQAFPRYTSLDRAVDDWGELAWEYGHSYLTTSPEVLIVDLAADLTELIQRAADERGDSRRRDLSRAVAQLAALTAMTLTNLGHVQSARRWWRTARHAADTSQDTFTQVWVRSEEGIRALYTHRLPQAAVDRADEALAVGNSVYGAKALAAKAQALALMGRPDEARTVVQTIEPLLGRMPAELVGDEYTVYGWPEHCLRHAESYVYSHIGDSQAAFVAQHRAYDLYPSTETRSRALVQLHEALCHINDGHIDHGIEHALATMTTLPATQRTTLILQIGHRVIDSVPDNERRRSSVSHFSHVLALPAGGSPSGA
jgi:transcriptional regulator with XRE-family HTH domain